MNNNDQTANTDLQVLEAKRKAEFALSPVGQMQEKFAVMQRMAGMYASSTIVPASYSGNVGNCVIALDIAMRLEANPLMIMQNLYVVHGNPSFSSKFLIATINASRKFTPLRYEFRGDEGKLTYSCRCYAYESSDRERTDPLYGDWISLKMAEDEGWSKKNGSKWRTMPNQMMRYRAAAFWQRVYCPEISMGFLTAEEYEDIEDAEYVEVSSKRPNKAALSKINYELQKKVDEDMAELTGEEQVKQDVETIEPTKENLFDE